MVRDTIDRDSHVSHRRWASSAHKARTLHTGSRCTFPIGFSWDAIVVRLRWDFRSGVACVPKRNHKIKTPAFQSRGIRQGVHPSQILISNENASSASMLRCHMLILCEKSPSVQPKRKRPGSKSRWTSLHSLACGRGARGGKAVRPDHCSWGRILNVTAIAPGPPTSAEAEVVLPVGVGGIPGARNRRWPAALVSTGGSPAAIMGWAQHLNNTIVTKYRTHGRTGPDLLVSQQTAPFMPPEH